MKSSTVDASKISAEALDQASVTQRQTRPTSTSLGFSSGGSSMASMGKVNRRGRSKSLLPSKLT
ncbi:hypothetical protein ACP_2375 [Acidobacterium capsulatum ATCC 51196]|uniref:Uncharacterized protein n=1 Tax=Acidobacterium capsulatum (strain ATCC 51196 / DSM 11244 / BCRC 80197 / JCM 7670 / NBRC 15755 / NCIMB 13165 / 161) TaxID=240015 RepID=C1F173_ACIC5|nr:hypothetical protein ACP_2375 [Acidobacterium capsulatum ATCC 51196]